MVSPIYIRLLIVLLLLTVIIGITTVIFRNGSSGPDSLRSTNQQLPRNIDVSLKQARFSEIRNGQVAWELVAEKVDYDKNGDTAYLSGIRMMFHKNSLQGAATITADKGEYSSTTKAVHLRGHVHCVTESGATFKTDSVVYTGASDNLSTVDSVVFSHNNMQLTAIGMELGVKKQQAHFFSSVSASIVMK